MSQIKYIGSIPIEGYISIKITSFPHLTKNIVYTIGDLKMKGKIKMKLTKEQWETILKTLTSQKLEVLEMPNGSFRFKFMPGTENECISNDLTVRGDFDWDASEVMQLPKEVGVDLICLFTKVVQLTKVVSETVKELGATENHGKIFMEGDSLCYLTNSGKYKKSIFLYRGSEGEIEQLQVAPICKGPVCTQEELEKYRKEKELTDEISIMDRKFISAFENLLPTKYLEVLLDEKVYGGKDVVWNDLKSDVVLIEKHGSEKMKELIDIVETLIRLEA